MKEPRNAAADVLDVRAAAAAVGRHPETIRRWVWSGQLPARREGRRLLVDRVALESFARTTDAAMGIAEWAEVVGAARQARHPGTRTTASDLVLEDRNHRSERADRLARR
jgi:hypothetical protein